MRAVTVLLFFLVLIVVGFGYLLSSNLYIRDDLAAAQQQIREITEKQRITEEQLIQANTEIADLKRQNDVILQEKHILEEQILQGQDREQTLKYQNATQQEQIDRLNRVNVLIGSLANLDANSIKLALFVPLLPISLASSILIYRTRKTNQQFHTRKDDKSKSVFTMQVTSEEMKLLRDIRRNKTEHPKC